jgi:hypothetical protein
MIVMIVVKMRYRCTYAHLEGTWGSGDIASFILSLTATTGVSGQPPALAALDPQQEALFP